MEEGHASEAERVLTRLEALGAERMEPRLLKRVMVHRQHAPVPGWSRAFLDAWAELGRPDFEHAHLLADVDLDSRDSQVDDELWRGNVSATARWVLALVSSPLPVERARWMLGQIPALKDVALLVAAFSVLSREPLPGELREQVIPVVRLRLLELVGAHSLSMQLRLLLLLMGTSEDAVFSGRELDALDAASELPLWREHSFEELFQRARSLLKAVGLPGASGQAFSLATLSITDRGSALLRRRAKATRSQLLPGSRYRLGRILCNVGMRMSGEATLSERMLGLLMVKRGAEDMGALDELAKADAMLDEVRAAQAAWRRAALIHWPLHSLAEEMLEASARDEMACLRTFMEPLDPR
jgi:hypothetical protein